jgi:hypothetical protein
MASKIKVSEATVQKLRKGTMAGNLAKAKGASPELKEALIRFYGTKRVNDAISKATVNKYPPTKMPPSEKPKKPIIDRGPGMKKPTPAQIAAGKDATKKANNAKLTPNNREGRKTVLGSPKPMPGPGGRMPKKPAGGPGAKPRPSKGQTPNQREGRRSIPSIKPGGGPGSKPRPARPSGGPGSKPRNPKPVSPNMREDRRSVPKIKMSGGPGAKPRTKTYRMKAGG